MAFTIASFVFITVFAAITLVSVLEDRQTSCVLGRFNRYFSIQIYRPAQKRFNLTFHQRIIQPVLDTFQSIINARLSDEFNKKFSKMLLNAGYPLNLTPAIFLVKKVICILMLTAFTVAVLTFRKTPAQLIISAAFFSTAVPTLIFFVMLRLRIRRRKTAIERELPELLDFIQVAVEAGLSIDSAVERLVSESKNCQEMIREFRIYLQDVKMGINRVQALQHLYYRTNAELVKNFTDGIIQSWKSGITLGNILQIIRRDIYDGIRSKAEKKAMKAPIKMMIPLVLFIFPTVFIIVLGPAAIKLMASLSNSGLG